VTRYLIPLLLVLALSCVGVWAAPVLMHPEDTPPTMTAAVVASNGTTLTLTFDEQVRANGTPASDGFTFAADGVTVTTTYASGDGTNTWVLTSGRTIQVDEVLTISYDSSTGDLEDKVDQEMLTFTPTPVTNNSTQTPPAPSGQPILAAAETQKVANGGSISFTPTLIQGTGLKYAASGLPTGASINASTGAVTGTLSTSGLWKMKITAYIDEDSDNTFDSNEQNDYITVGVIVYSSTVTVDAAWVAAAGGFPVTIKGPSHRLYEISEDLDASGTAFILANPNIYIDGNGNDLHYGGANGSTSCTDGFTNREHAFELYVGFSVEKYPATITGGTAATNCAIVDLNIINDGTDVKSHAIDSNRTQGLLFADSTVTTAGKDSHCVFMQNGSGGTTYILNNILTTTTTTSCDRHAGPANVGSGGSAAYVVERSVLLGGNSAITCYSGSVIYKNLLSHSCPVTNGYGVFVYRTTNVTIKNNLIIPTNGRGILFNAGNGHVAKNNVILHLESPNGEFGSQLNPPAIRGRYDTGSNIYSDNTSLGIGGTDRTSASTIYITSDGTGSCIYSNNTGDVILIGDPDADHYAQPITLEGTTNGIDDINNNTLRSNHNIIRVEGYDGYPVQLTPLTDNSFEWVTGDDAYADFMVAVNDLYDTFGFTTDVATSAATRIADIDTLVDGLISGVPLYASKAAWHVKYYAHSGTTSSMDVLDSDWGTVDSDSWTNGSSSLSAGSVNVREGFTQSVQILAPGGSPLANVTVTVTSDQGDVTTELTDGSGNATLKFFRFAIVKANPDGSAVSVVSRTSSTVSYLGDSAVITHASVPATLELN
jgi:hypothetical protein